MIKKINKLVKSYTTKMYKRLKEDGTSAVAKRHVIRQVIQEYNDALAKVLKPKEKKNGNVT